MELEQFVHRRLDGRQSCEIPFQEIISGHHHVLKGKKGKGKSIAVCETSPHRYGKSLNFIINIEVVPLLREF